MFSGLASLLFGNTTDSDTNNTNTGESTNTGNNLRSSTDNSDNNPPSISDSINFGLLSIETEEDDWLLIDKKEEVDEEEESLPQTDSEEESHFVEIKRPPRAEPRRHHNRIGFETSSSPYPQTHPVRHQIPLVDGSGYQQISVHPLCTTTESLSPQLSTSPNSFLSSTYLQRQSEFSNAANNNNTISAMEESWFLTPPPCFTSTGPVNMETSPFENLLIEHPSMSVYHSIRSAQEGLESFVNLDLGENTPPAQGHLETRKHKLQQVRARQHKAEKRNPPRNTPAGPIRVVPRIETLPNTQIREAALLRESQKVHDKKDRQTTNSRSALKRGNKVRDFNSKGHRQRRSDLQHCKIISGANNNRKC